LFILILTNRLSFSQIDSSDIYNLTFAELSILKITTASKAPQKIVEIPATSLFLSVGMGFDQSSIYDQVYTPQVGLKYELFK